MHALSDLLNYTFPSLQIYFLGEDCLIPFGMISKFYDFQLNFLQLSISEMESEVKFRSKNSRSSNHSDVLISLLPCPLHDPEQSK